MRRRNGVPATNGAVANWETIRGEWRNVRDRLELAVEGIGRKAARAKYSKYPRYSYHDVVSALRRDGAIKPAAGVALLNMNQCFLTCCGRVPAT